MSQGSKSLRHVQLSKKSSLEKYKLRIKLSRISRQFRQSAQFSHSVMSDSLCWWKRLGFREQKTNETIKLLWGEMNRDLGWRDAKNKGEESNGRKRKQKTEQMACIRGTML